MTEEYHEYKCFTDEELDMICWDFYGKEAVQSGIVEYMLNYNQDLSHLGTHFPSGTVLRLPPVPLELLNQSIQQIPFHS